MKKDDGFPTLTFPSQQEWEAWLREHHADTPGVWLVMAKKGSGIASLTHDTALESALCYGWIDGQAASIDGTHWRQKFTPRRARSTWSRVNRDKAMALIEAGRMQPAGHAEIERAQRDGRWEAAYEPPSTIAVPDDLREALEREPEARAFFDTLDSQNHYAILFRIHNAKRPETRAKRIATFVAMLSRGEKLHP